MNMKLASVIAGGLSVVTASGLIAPPFISNSEYKANGTYVINEDNKAVLLGIENPEDYFLGEASQFSVFVHGDFTAEGSDCEGRIAAGGSANLNDELPFYSVGAKVKEQQPDVAHIVVGGDSLKNFEVSSLNMVAPPDAAIDTRIMEYNENGNCKVYQGELFDFDETFRHLAEQSAYVSEQKDNAELVPDQYTRGKWTIVGTDKNLNVLELTGEQYDIFTTDGQYIDLTVQIPEGSYLVVNVAGDKVSLPRTEVKVQYTTGNMEELEGENLPVLYNLYQATEFKYSGSIQGSTLAPAANGSGDEGGHVSGLTVANSFKGGIQFGYSTFNPTKLEMGQKNVDDSTITTTTTTTTTTTSTTTTTQQTTTTTKFGAVAPAEETATTTTNSGAVAPAEETATTTTNGGIVLGDGETGTSTATETTTTDSSTTATSTTNANAVTSTTKTVKTDSPKTGDNNIASILTALMGVSAAAAFASRKRNK
ncbi:MAG: choice-of-anchor A family protein [Ruminococcus sp.]|nr:choice-of-anchor A family protein [Ruminococcus sp.]